MRRHERLEMCSGFIGVALISTLNAASASRIALAHRRRRRDGAAFAHALHAQRVQREGDS